MNKYILKMLSAGVTMLVCGAVSLHAQNPHGNSHRAAALPLKKDTEPVMVQVTNPAGTTSINLTYTLPEAGVKSTGSRLGTTELYEVNVGNAFQKGNEGEPVLPVIPVQVIIPAGYSFDKVAILDSKRKQISGTHRIRHGQANIPLIPGARQRTAEPEARIYGSDNAYPSSIVEVVGIQYKKGVPVAFLQLHPVAYQPKSGKISVCTSVSFELQLKRETTKNHLKPRPKELNAATLQVENPEAIDTYNQESIAPLDGSVSPLGICDPAQSFRYVIVTADSFATATTDYTIRDLVAQKQSRGITTTVVTIGNVLANYTGVDNAERLRNFIIDAYTNWETDFVLLGGDINIIPMRKLYCNASGEVDQIPSDLYYQCLDGNFNSDNDSYWGEPTDGPGGTDIDLMAEVYIGRASAENKIEMSNFVFKTLAYENAPENSSYLRKALMVGEYLGFGGVSEYATGSMEEIRLGSSASGYTTAGFASSPLFSVDTLYDRSGYEWPASEILSRMSSGIYGIYNHLGHANYNYVMKFYNASADALTNNNFFFAYSQGCIPGNFEADCIAEHLTTSNRHGAYAVVFNARYGWGQFNSTDGPSQRFDRQFWDAYFAESMTNLGALNADSHEDNIWDINGDCIRWCYYETNLLGDPQTSVRGKVVGPSLAYSSHTINDANGGNGDGLINPGESIDVTLTAANVGTDSARGVTATISESDQYVTVTTGTTTFGTIQCCGASRAAQTPIRLSIASGCPTPRTITLSCLLRDSRDSTWNSNFSITVYTSSLVSGFVRTISGANPIAGATVSFSGPVSGSVTTNASGAYMFGGINGTYSISATAPGYVQSSVQSVVVPPSAANINFLLGRPMITVTPASVKRAGAIGDSVQATVTTQNSGDMPLYITATPNENTGSASAPASITYDKSHYVTIDKDAIDTREGEPQVLTRGGPDSAGYRWIDSKESGGPVFVWRDISATGRLLSTVSGCDDCNESATLSFPFKFYGNTFNSLYVSSNGYITFGTASSQCSNYPLPSTSMPVNLIAGFFDDLYPSTAGDIYFQDFGDYAIVQFNGISIGSGSYTCTFQIVLNRTGTINLYYNRITGSQTGCTVGIQNETRNVGLNVVYNASYLADSLAIEFRTTPAWISVSPLRDTIPAGQSKQLTIRMRSSGLNGGTQAGAVMITHNSPQTISPLAVPCTLIVDGMRRLAVTPTTVNFGSNWVGVSDTALLTLSNAGNEATQVTSVTSTNSYFSTITSLPLTVPAFGSTTLRIVYRPVATGNHSGTMTVISNAEDNSSIPVSVTGTCLLGPQIRISPVAFHESLNAGDSVTRTLTIENSGDDTLLISGDVQVNQLQIKNFLPIFPLSTRQITTISGKSIECTFKNSSPTIKDTIAVAVFGNSNTTTLASLLVNSGYKARVLSETEINSGALQNYDVLVMIHNTTTLNSSTRLSVESFVNQGGGLITEWSSSTLLFSAVGPNPYNVQTPQWGWFQGTIGNGNMVASSTPITITDPRSGVVSGISSPFSAGGATEFFYTLSGYTSQLNIIATYYGHAGTWPALLEGKYGRGCVISHLFDSGDDLSNAVIQRLWTNSVEQAKNGAAAQWLSINTDSMRISPHTTSTMLVKFNSVNLLGGDHYGTISIRHNVAGTISPLSIPCTLSVDGFRRLSVSPTTLNFGSLWVGLQDTISLSLINMGNEATQVNSITSDNGVFSISGILPITVPPADSVVVVAVYRPATTGNHTGTILITSNAEDNPSITLRCSGSGRTPPVASVAPDSLYYHLLPSDPASTQVCYVRNTGGDTLQYHVQGINQLSSPSFTSTAAPLPELQNERIYSANNLENEYINGRVIIGTAQGFSSPQLSSLDKVGYRNIRELGIARNPRTGLKVTSSRKAFLVTLSDTTKDGVLKAVEMLKNEPSIAYAEPDYVVKAYVTPNDSYFSQLYGMFNNGQTGGTVDADIDATDVWERHTGNRSILIGIIDTGIDYIHPDLAANIWTNPGEIPGNSIDDDHNGYIDDIHGWDFAYDDSNPTDGHYHGTHCAGTIAGVGNNGIGVAGVMWTASLVALKFLDDAGSGATSDAIDAVNYANAMGIKITSNSWGGGGFSQALMDVIAQGGLFIAAAGNNGTDNDASPQYPASYALDNIISVAATDHNDLIASFSCYGRTTVDLGAPGVNIYSCQPASRYQTLSGTSMATPHVSGSAGLIWSYNPFLSALQVKQLLLDNVDPVSSLNGKCLTGGRLNIDRALRAAGPTWLTASPMAGGKVAPGDSAVVSVTVTPTGLLGGRYEGEIMIGTNDPAHQQLRVAATADIDGFRSLSISPAAINFGAIWAGLRDTVLLTLSNSGNEATIVNSVTSSNSAFIVSGTIPLTIAPSGSAKISIIFHPLSEGNYNGTLTVNSNAEDNPVIAVQLSGTAILAPQLTVTPASFSYTLNSGDSTTGTMVIKNFVAPGNGSLIFNIDILNSQMVVKGIPELIQPEKPIVLTGLTAQGESKPSDSMIPAPLTRNRFTASGLRILYANTSLATDASDNFVAGLRTLSNVDTVKVLNCASSTPNLAYLQGYDIVVVYSGNSWADGTAMGNVLADFVDGGGKVCILEASFCSGGSWVLGGRIMQSGYSPFAITTYTYSETASATAFENHPITANVTSITTSLYAYTSSLQGNSNSLGRFTNGYHVAAINLDKPIVAINVFPRDGYWGGDVIQMMGNTFDFFAGSKWLNLSSYSDTLEPGDSTILSVMVNSRDLEPGMYLNNISISHNAINAASPLGIPCTLNVRGFRSLTASPASLNFGSLQEGMSDTLLLTLSNAGSEATVVNSITSSNSSFRSLRATPVSVAPRSSSIIPVVFQPSGMGSFTGDLTIISNAENNPTITIGLTGSAIAGPSIVVSPQQVNVSLTAGGSTQRTVSIANIGGADLIWSTAHRTGGIISRETHDTIPGIQSKTYSATHDLYCDNWSDAGSDAFDGFGNPRVTVGATSSSICMLEGDSSYTINGYKVRVRNDFAENHIYRSIIEPHPSETSTRSDITVAFTGNMGSDGSETVYLDSVSIGGKWIRFYVNQVSYPNSDPRVVFLIVPSKIEQLGNVRYSHNSDNLTMEALNISLPATVYIIPSYHDLSAIKTWFQNELTLQSSWLTVTPESGTTHGGQISDMQFSFNATGLTDGLYYDTISISHNSLTQISPLKIPVELHVGASVPGISGFITSIGVSALPVASGTRFRIVDLRAGSPLAGKIQGSRFMAILR